MPDEVFWLLSFFGLGTFTLLGMRIWLNARIQSRRGVPREDFERLAENIDRLHEGMRIVRDEVAELHERMDFAERVLTRGGSSPRLPKDRSTPT